MLGTVGIPNILLAILIALPFIDLRRERRLLRRPVAIVAAIVVVLAMGMLTYKGATAKEALGSELSGVVPEWAEEQGFADNADAVAGAELFAELRLPPVPHVPRHGRRQPRRARPLRRSARRTGAPSTSRRYVDEPGAVRQQRDAAVRGPRRGEPAASSARSSPPPRARRTSSRMSVFLGVTGASGAPYAARLLRALADAGCEVGLAASAAGIEVLATELYGDATLPRDEVLERFTGGAGERHRLRRQRLQEPVRVRLGEGRRLRRLPLLDVDGRHARGGRDGEPDPPRRLGRAEGGAQARPRAARDAALARST